MLSQRNKWEIVIMDVVEMESFPAGQEDSDTSTRSSFTPPSRRFSGGCITFKLQGPRRKECLGFYQLELTLWDVFLCGTTEFLKLLVPIASMGSRILPVPRSSSFDVSTPLLPPPTRHTRLPPRSLDESVVTATYACFT